MVRIRYSSIAPLLLVLLFGCGSPAPRSDVGSGAATVAPPRDPVAREVLGSEPAKYAPGYTLYLYKVTIQPGAKLPRHRHPGTQIARIEAGTLTYYIDSGTAGVGRAGSPEAVEHLTATAEITLNSGDTVYENESLIHHAENKGAIPVVVMLTALLRTGEELSIPVE